jgi:hypothetical protein
MFGEAAREGEAVLRQSSELACPARSIGRIELGPRAALAVPEPSRETVERGGKVAAVCAKGEAEPLRRHFLPAGLLGLIDGAQGRNRTTDAAIFRSGATAPDRSLAFSILEKRAGFGLCAVEKPVDGVARHCPHRWRSQSVATTGRRDPLRPPNLLLSLHYLSLTICSLDS